jgi:hypothetical protein
MTFLHYNFIRRHETLGTAPAVKVGLVDHPWTMLGFVAMIEDQERRIGGRISDYQTQTDRVPAE